MSQILFKDIEDRVILWFESTNKYVVVQKEVSDIIHDLHNEVSENEIALRLSRRLNTPWDVTVSFVSDIKADIYSANLKKGIEQTKSAPHLDELPVSDSFISKFYGINDSTFQIDYQSNHELRLVHPKFAHLEVDAPDAASAHFKVLTHQKLVYLIVDNHLVGTWDEKNIHFFQGKFSMEIIQKLYQKKEDEWMGVFHASAVGKGESCALILGDSGNGKSTSLALLQAHGFECLADDFVPVDSKNNLVHTFPAAISIKRNSIGTLLPYYPELEDLIEIEFEKQQKIVKYLPPKSLNHLPPTPCKVLIFIKYTLGEPCALTPISNIDAFQQIVTDSWLSPLKPNVEGFLNWFEGLPCYQLAYCDNSKMVATIEDLFKDDL